MTDDQHVRSEDDHGWPPDRQLPELSTLVAAADDGLHPWIKQRVPVEVRTAALAVELGFWLNTAARDMAHAMGFAAHAPSIGQPAAAYLDRWLPLSPGTSVLAGPRYLGRDPELPFVGVTAADRVLGPPDKDSLIALARAEFEPFGPKFVLLSSAGPVHSWPGCRSEKRFVVGELGELRSRPVTLGLSTRPHDVGRSFDDYHAIYERDQAADPVRRRWAQAEDREDFVRLADSGMIFDVLIDGEWAGVVAAEMKSKGGICGAVVQELTLDHQFRGHGYGHQLSLLLARALPLDDDQLLLGTIHVDNVSAYQAALQAGRVDVGGEILIPSDWSQATRQSRTQ